MTGWCVTENLYTRHVKDSAAKKPRETSYQLCFVTCFGCFVLIIIICFGGGGNFMRFGNFTRLRLQEEKSRGGVRPVPHSVELTLEASAAEVADAEAGDRVRPLEERVQIPEERALKNKMFVDCDVPSRNPSCSLLSKL